jgi:DNA mismatch repair protein MutS
MTDEKDGLISADGLPGEKPVAGGVLPGGTGVGGAGLDPAQLTPAMRQWQQFKTEHPESTLFFRMGDFYECFFDDAKLVARVLGVALTSRSKGENAIPMAGVPYHAVDGYLQRMIAAGYKVAICEQVEDPKTAKGLVKREVTRLVTPGTVTEDNLLDRRQESFVAALVLPGFGGGATEPAVLTWCELSTGKFMTLAGEAGACLEELARVQPRELVLVETADQRLPAWATRLKEQYNMALTPRPAWQFSAHHATKMLREHYGVARFAGFGYEENDPVLRVAGALLTYLHETQKTALEHMQPPQAFVRDDYLMIDPASLRSLEVLRSLRQQSAVGSLIQAVDQTSTPMGARLLRNWLCFPLRDLGRIQARHERIAQMLEETRLLEQIVAKLEECSDIERITARICCRRVSPRDLVALARTLEALVAVGLLLEAYPSAAAAWGTLVAQLPAAAQIAGQIRAAVQDEPNAHIRDGGVIRPQYHAELDRLRQLNTDSRGWLAEYQARLVQESGINGLKVGYNKVFGFYIEVTHTHADKVPATFIRKQTVRNAERYITPELKQYEGDILTAQERSLALEAELFEQLRVQLAGVAGALQQVAQAVAELDVIAGLAQLARQRRYIRPEMVADTSLHIVEGRHPVVEHLLGSSYVPNDVEFSAGGPTLQLITGPNMAGKSTYIRQVALLVLLAQAGSYIPAQTATIGVVDRIFTRVGASDDLAGGQSTFMVEMTETANILLHATERSLVILDEIGRGTSTLDGLALAWAIAEFLADTGRSRTLFATHYHELTDLADTNPAVKNLNVLVREWEEQIVFLHRIAPGRADKSYGLHVARLAGVPRSVVVRAKALLEQLSVQVGRGRPRAASVSASAQPALFDPPGQQVLGQLRALDLDRMSPIQAWEALRTLKGQME